MNSAGKMKSAAGKSILIGALAAASSASERRRRARRRRRDCAASGRARARAARPGAASGRTTSTSGELSRLAMRLSARSLLSPTRSSVRTSANSSASGPVHALDQPRDRTEEANACFDRHRQQIECIREVVADLLAARGRAAAEQKLGMMKPTTPKSHASRSVAPKGWPRVRRDQQRRKTPPATSRSRYAT